MEAPSKVERFRRELPPIFGPSALCMGPILRGVASADLQPTQGKTSALMWFGETFLAILGRLAGIWSALKPQLSSNGLSGPAVELSEALAAELFPADLRLTSRFHSSKGVWLAGESSRISHPPFKVPLTFRGASFFGEPALDYNG